MYNNIQFVIPLTNQLILIHYMMEAVMFQSSWS